MVSNPRVVYVVFDRFPAPKGAAIHIAAFSRTLGEVFGPVELLTVADEPSQNQASRAVPGMPGVTHSPLPAPGKTVLDRAMAFRSHFAKWRRGRKFEVVHFRSIFEGFPIALHKRQVCDRIVFEVNGLPSVELKYHYPAVADDRELLDKLIAQEQCCIDAADLLITVSDVTANYLVARGADRGQIRVIPNGVDLGIFGYSPPRVWAGREVKMLYSGTLASWQGADRAVEALALIRRDRPASLTLVGPASRRRKEELAKLCDTLGVGPFVCLLEPCSQEQLAGLYRESDVAVAPLLRNDRNIVQGCCPLKVLEAMACGTPLVASDLPVVQALAQAETEALLVRPGSPKAIKDAMLRLESEAGLAQRLSSAAREKVERRYTWDIAGRALIDAYESILGIRPTAVNERKILAHGASVGNETEQHLAPKQHPTREQHPAPEGRKTLAHGASHGKT
ncbi:MAG TPA: glycosyltransferase family 4 protein [Tepidisphaeraceae bacterium]|nr:glycosyltransferase family 4 protein [Tepidisphaeraceae bacterium]